MLTLLSTYAALDLSANNLLTALIVLVIAIILFVALWGLVKPYLGQFANLVGAIIVIIVLLIIARIFGVI